MHRLVSLLLPLALVGLVAAACGGSDEAGDSWSAEALGSRRGPVEAQIISGSQIGQGPARLAFGIIRSDEGSLVHDATARVTLYTLDGDEGTSVGEFELTPVQLLENTEHHHDDGTRHLHDDPLATVYVLNTTLDRTDWWGASLDIEADGKEYKDVRTRFFVADKTSEPAIGAEVPAISQLTTKDVQDVAMIDSSNPPRPELHDLTVADALKNGKPTLIAFATPAFCQTRFCGPVVDSVVVPLQEKYGERMNFVHIEPYKLGEARNGRLVAIPEMATWGLQSEPWVFVLDASGRVAAKFEGVMSQEEVEPFVQRVLDAQAARN
ncbi:MAG: TlpA family protein disulfide reductase [Dehalococcoidia bacterium]